MRTRELRVGSGKWMVAKVTGAMERQEWTKILKWARRLLLTELQRWTEVEQVLRCHLSTMRSTLQ